MGAYLRYTVPMETPTPTPPHGPNDDAEPTVAMPVARVAEPAAAAAPVPVESEAIEPLPVHPPQAAVLPAQPMPPAPPRPAYVFGNPFAYAIRRGLALAIDLVVPTVSLGALFYGQIAINPVTGLPVGNETAFDVTLGGALAASLVYVVLAQAIFGTTLGKLFFGLHVYPRRGRFVGFGRALMRTLVLPIDLCAIGPVLVLLPGHRRLGDLVAGTVVAQSPLRAFAPLLGVVGIAVIAAAPFLLGAGPEHVLATLGAFLAFGPHIAARAFDMLMALAGTGGSHP
jgi:uncharacterized RDD family membrane protein YckC